MEKKWDAFRMNNILTHQYTQLFFRYILGTVFIYASYDKIIDPQSFSDLIDNYHITPIFINNLAALFLPWLELIIGVSLITGIYIKASINIVIALLIWFIFILSQAVIRGINTSCGCFKVTENLANTDFKLLLIKRIFEDVVFLGMAMLIKLGYKIKR